MFRASPKGAFFLGFHLQTVIDEKQLKTAKCQSYIGLLHVVFLEILMLGSLHTKIYAYIII